VWVAAAVILIFGVFPDAIVSLTRRSTPTLATDSPQNRRAVPPPRAPLKTATATVATDTAANR
jgi:hypothetical protein